VSKIHINKYVAIEPIEFKKVESKVEGGFARIAQKIELTSSFLVFDHSGVSPAGKPTYYEASAKAKVILSGEAGLAAWNKRVYEYKGKKFVLCPLSEVLGWDL